MGERAGETTEKKTELLQKKLSNKRKPTGSSSSSAAKDGAALDVPKLKKRKGKLDPVLSILLQS